MKQNFKNYLKLGILLFGISFLLINCQKDFDIEENTQNHYPIKKLRIKINTGANVTSSVVGFINKRSIGSLRLNTGGINVLARETVLGTVDTSKEIVVENETNTKHTFNVKTTSTDINSVINVIVVETVDFTYEYFKKYNFVGEIPFNDDKSIDLTRFTGSIETFNSAGELTGVVAVLSGDIIAVGGNNNPCPDDDGIWDGWDDFWEQLNNGGTTNGTGGENTDGTNGTEENDDGTAGSNTNGGTTGDSGGWLENGLDEPCAINWYVVCTNGLGNSHDPLPINSAGDECSGTNNGAGILIVKDCNGTVLGSSNNSSTANRNGEDDNPCGRGFVGVLIEVEDDCTTTNEDFNAFYTEHSPFNVDLSEVRKDCNITTIDTVNVAENEKFMCIYNKLIQSPKFKNLFIDTFGESENLNVTFEIVDNLPISTGQTNEPNGDCKAISYTLDQATGEVDTVNIRIRLRKDYVNNQPSFSVARTILHESLHAYLQLKKLNCNLGTTLEELNDTTLGTLLNEYFDGSCVVNQEDHEFMFDFMIPTMQEILGDVRDDLISTLVQQIAESQTTFQNENTINGYPLTPWNWDQFYFYFSLSGLQDTESYIQEITGLKAANFFDYNTHAKQNFNVDCID